MVRRRTCPLQPVLPGAAAASSSSPARGRRRGQLVGEPGQPVPEAMAAAWCGNAVLPGRRAHQMLHGVQVHIVSAGHREGLMGESPHLRIAVVQRQHRRPRPARVVHPLQQPVPGRSGATRNSVSPRPAASIRPRPTARCAGSPGSTRCRTSVGVSSGSPDQVDSSTRWAARCHGSYAAVPTSSSPPPCGTTDDRRAPANRRAAAGHSVPASTSRSRATRTASMARNNAARPVPRTGERHRTSRTGAGAVTDVAGLTRCVPLHGAQ